LFYSGLSPPVPSHSIIKTFLRVPVRLMPEILVVPSRYCCIPAGRLSSPGEPRPWGRLLLSNYFLSCPAETH